LSETRFGEENSGCGHFKRGLKRFYGDAPVWIHGAQCSESAKWKANVRFQSLV